MNEYLKSGITEDNPVTVVDGVGREAQVYPGLLACTDASLCRGRVGNTGSAAYTIQYHCQCDRGEAWTDHEPLQNEDTSFMSSQIPEKLTALCDQFVSASAQYLSAFSENQSGKT